YRTRDVTRLLPGTARNMRRMEKVTGRSDDMMIVRGGNVFPSQIEELILKVAGLAPHYQIILTREGRMDEMDVVVEAADDAPRAEAGPELAHLVKSHVGISARVRVGVPGSVERSQGKARRVVDRRGT